MKKRLLAMLMAGAMTLTMTACGGPKTDEGEGGSAQAGGKTYKIALLMSHQTNAFTTAVSEGAKVKGEERTGGCFRRQAGSGTAGFSGRAVHLAGL